MYNVRLDITESMYRELQSAHGYVYSHYELSTQNEDDREAVSTLMRLAELVLSKPRDKE